MANRVKCKYCGTYVFKSDAFRVGLSSFCDRAHYYEHQNQAPKASKKSTPVKRKPKPTRQDFSSVPEVTYSTVMAADRHRCRMCGGRNSLAVHHIYYRSEARWFPWCSQRHNLITLCNDPCHLQVVHRNKKKWQRICLAAVWLRDVEGRASMTLRELEEKYGTE